MKTLFIAGSLFFSFASFANDQVSFDELKAVSAQTAHIFSQETCHFKTEVSQDQLRLVLNVDQENMVILAVKPQDVITSTEEAHFDGSFQYSYEIQGVGQLTITHADDSFDRVELSDGLYSANCEIQL